MDWIRGTLGKGTFCMYPSLRVPTPAPVQTGIRLIELGEGFLEEEFHTKSTAIDADLCFSVSTLEFVLLR